MANKDTILYENYSNNYSANKAAIVFSVTKVFVTSLVAIAIEEGKIKGLEQKVSDFLPAFKEGGRAEMTIEHLLQMTSGLNYSDYENYITAGMTYYNANLLRFVNKAKLAHPPGTHFAYKSIDTQVLGLCLEKAVGKTIAAYLQEKIWEPLGMEYDAYFTIDSKRHGNERMYGGLAMASRDLLKMGRLFLNDGKWEGQQILPKHWVKQASQKNLNPDKWWGYTNGWWLDTYAYEHYLATTDYFAAGFNGQFLYVNPAQNLLVVRTGFNKGEVRWGRVIGQFAEEMAAKNRIDKLDIGRSPQAFIGEYHPVKTKDAVSIFIAYENDEWKITEFVQEKTRARYKVERYCRLSLDNQKKRLRLIFTEEEGKIKGFYLDTYSQNMVYYGRRTPTVSID